MTVYGDYVSSYTGLYWKMTYPNLEFDMPYTRERIILGPLYTSLLTWGSALIFVFFVRFIAPLFKTKDLTIHKKIAYWHYVGLCFYSAIACGGTILLMTQRGEWTDLNAWLCNPAPDWYRLLSITFTFSKIWEWLDTLWLITIGGKTLQQIGFLHLYHHMTTLFLFIFTMNFPGTEKIGLLLNGFVHTLMYAHYAFRLPKPLRPLITIAQIIQLALGTASHQLNITTCKEFTGYVENHPWEFWVPYLFVPVYLLAFIRFFWQTYVSAPEQTKTKDAKGATAPAAAPAKTKND